MEKSEIMDPKIHAAKPEEETAIRFNFHSLRSSTKGPGL